MLRDMTRKTYKKTVKKSKSQRQVAKENVITLEKMKKACRNWWTEWPNYKTK